MKTIALLSLFAVLSACGDKQDDTSTDEVEESSDSAELAESEE